MRLTDVDLKVGRRGLIHELIHGDCLEELKKLPDHSVDSVVTDPPYGLSQEPNIREVLEKWLAGEDYTHRGGGFMGKSWDSFVPGPSVWREVYRVLKPGGHALVFAGARTQDLMTISLRLAGFEVRDVIEWLYFSGFPKSMDVSKAIDKKEGVEGTYGDPKSEAHANWIQRGRMRGHDGHEGYQRPWMQDPEAVSRNARKYIGATELSRKWDGWGTALKPAHEPIIMVRKPLDGTVAENVERWGTGAINVDGCRIPTEDKIPNVPQPKGGTGNIYGFKNGKGRSDKRYKSHDGGRFPANIITTEPDAFWSKYCNVTPPELSKKASKKDRNSDWLGEEIDLPERVKVGEHDGRNAFPKNSAGEKGKHSPRMRNTHPTVKPTDLMAWLVRLITPPGGIVLDPFAGSGSTLVAAKREGFGFIGIELEAEYIEIAEARTMVTCREKEISAEL